MALQSEAILRGFHSKQTEFLFVPYLIVALRQTLMMDEQSRIRDQFNESIAVKQRSIEILLPHLAIAVQRMVHSLHGGGKILACGNGGSAGDALHFASELINRYERVRRALPAIALTGDTLTLTSVANDEAFAQVFARQVAALGRAEDLLLAITTSGDSLNVIEAVRIAQKRKMSIIALTGKDGGKLAQILRPDDLELRVPAQRTARIQETHLLIIHCLCDGIDQQLFASA